jgi:DNA polymerase type B, organellar and viral
MIDISKENWFSKIVYPSPFKRFRAKEIKRVIGLDTEAYTDGHPFLICMSDGRTFRNCDKIDYIGKLFFRYKKQHIVVYNLKYDSGAILFHLTNEEKQELWIRNTVRHGAYRITYIPHKNLTIAKGKYRVKIWDIAQFFRSSLDHAAEKYLHKNKICVGSKDFTRHQTRNRKKLARIIRYCIRDAELTAELGNYFLAKLREFGIRPTSLYSQASLSFGYYAENGSIINSWRLWKQYRELLKYAVESYEGGKFEVTARGAFDGYEYDLCSAYPSAIRNLIDISSARIKFTKRYQKKAVYGFLRVKVFNPKGLYLPCGILRGNLRIYPAGEYYCTITKIEYEYLKKIKVRCFVYSAWWIFIDGKKTRPYKKTTDFLFSLKRSFKGKDEMLYSLTKIMLNGFYGKTCETRENWKGEFVAGRGWNPIYASQITAETRVKIASMQNLLKEKCIAVHTDSVITLSPLDKKLVTGKLGAFDFVCKGRGVLIACGQYALAGEAAYKGFEPIKDDSWWKLLEENKKRMFIKYPILKVESWVEAIAKGHYDKINFFSHETKRIDLNSDTKRLWLKKMKGGDLLKGLEQSFPVVIVENEIPEQWN